MAVGCGAKLSKGLLFLFNILVFLAGVGLFAIGIWLLVDDSARHYIDAVQGHDQSSQASLKAACITLIVVGAAAACISFCGCCGAIKENSCLLNTYAAILVLVLIIQIVAAILAIVFKGEIVKGVEKGMNVTVQTQYGMPGFEKETDSWNQMHVELKCCGTFGPEDWLSSAWYENQTEPKLAVPVSCCVLTNNDPTNPKPVDQDKCMAEATQKSGKYLHHTGCADAWSDFIKHNANIIIGVSVGFAVLLLLGAVMACCLRKNAHAGYQYV